MCQCGQELNITHLLSCPEGKDRRHRLTIDLCNKAVELADSFTSVRMEAVKERWEVRDLLASIGLCVLGDKLSTVGGWEEARWRAAMRGMEVEKENRELLANRWRLHLLEWWRSEWERRKSRAHVKGLSDGVG